MSFIKINVWMLIAQKQPINNQIYVYHVIKIVGHVMHNNPVLVVNLDIFILILNVSPNVQMDILQTLIINNALNVNKTVKFVIMLIIALIVTIFIPTMVSLIIFY